MSIPWNSYLFFGDKKKNEIWYFNDIETKEFFDALLSGAEERNEIILTGQLFWRAQLGCDHEPICDFDGSFIHYNVVPYSSKRMKPDPVKASEGRINSKGIPCLYLATNEKTAISEMRPWIGSYVTIAQFKVCTDLKVIDFSRGEIEPMKVTADDLDKLFKLKNTTAEEAMKTIWRLLDKDFSEPVDNDHNIAAYVPTQIIAELFKINGFDGVKYKSCFSNGKNIALFDTDSAKQVDKGKVVKVTEVDLDFKQKYPFQFSQCNKHE